MSDLKKFVAFASADTLEMRRLLKRIDEVPANDLAAHISALRVQHAMIGRDPDRLQKAVPA
ncbi:hypothetical protein [Mesorhizobium sp.]|uniref:hypothetical protein n=1 Tax=Mesorhizobium sp. TaxID=1871066 RepID=UPI003BA988A8